MFRKFDSPFIENATLASDKQEIYVSSAGGGWWYQVGSTNYVYPGLTWRLAWTIKTLVMSAFLSFVGMVLNTAFDISVHQYFLMAINFMLWYCVYLIFWMPICCRWLNTFENFQFFDCLAMAIWWILLTISEIMLLFAVIPYVISILMQLVGVIGYALGQIANND